MKGKKIVLKGLFVLMISFLIFGSKVNAYNISSIDKPSIEDIMLFYIRGER